MTIAHMAWVRRLRGIDGIARVILDALAEHAGEDGEAQIRHATLAELADCSVDTVQRRVSELERKGLLRREKRFRSDGGRAPSAIILPDPHAAGCGMGADVARDGAAEPQDVPPCRRLRHTPLPQAAAYPPAAGCGMGPDVVGAEGAEPQDEAAPRARAEPEPKTLGSNIPPISPKISESGAALGPARGLREATGTSVAAFLERWPLGAFEPPAPVEKVWQRLTEAERKAAIEGAPKWLDASKRAGRRPGKAVAFLRSKAWEAKATSRISAAQGGVFVILGTDAARAWLEYLRAENPATYRNGWPSWRLTTDPATSKAAVFMRSLFPPNAQGPPLESEGEAA